MKSSVTGLRRLANACRYSWLGLKASWQSEEAIRQEIIALVILLPLAIWLPVTTVAKALLIFSALLVLLVELLNSAIEAVVDRISDEYHPLSGKAKDIGSAAVMVALLNAAIVWLIILLPLVN